MKKMVCELCGSNDFTKDGGGLYACDYCRTKYTPEQAQKMLVEGSVRVDRSEDAAKLLGLAESSLQHDNPAEAYDYASRALEIEPDSRKGWFIKARAAGWSSNISKPRYAEMVGAFEKGISLASEDEQIALRAEAGQHLNQVAVAMYSISSQHVEENASVDKTWEEHINRVDDAIAMFQKAHEWGAGRQPLDNIVDVSLSLFKGPKVRNFDGSTTSRNLTPEGRTYFQKKINEAAVQIKQYDSSYVAPQPPAPETSSSCFVVTATLGRTDAPAVVTLRAFRDEVLVHSKFGERFLKWYEHNGPSLATLIRSNVALRALSFVLIVAPASTLAQIFLRWKL